MIELMSMGIIVLKIADGQILRRNKTTSDIIVLFRTTEKHKLSRNGQKKLA